MFHVTKDSVIIIPERPGSVSEDPGHRFGPFHGASVKPRSGQGAADALTHRIDLAQRQGFRGPRLGGKREFPCTFGIV